MGSYQMVFKRVEEKYILDVDKYNELMQKIKLKLVENEYPHSKILNIYYDTDKYDLAIKSIQNGLSTLFCTIFIRTLFYIQLALNNQVNYVF